MDTPEQTRAQWLNNLRWAQGEHFVMIGETGTGKTTLARTLLLRRAWVAAIAIKRHDDTLNIFRRDYDVIKAWPPPYGARRVLYWEKPRNFDDDRRVAAKVHRMLDEIYTSGGWCVYADDAGYMCGRLGLARDFTVLLSQGRSSNISMGLSMTRPKSFTQGVPLEAFSQVRLVMLFGTQDEGEHKRMAEIAGFSLREMRGLLRMLGPHDFIAVDHHMPTIVRN